MVAGYQAVGGYLAAWAARKARRTGARLDTETDLIDTELGKLHGLVAAKLGTDPALAQLEEAASTGQEITEQTRRRVTGALTQAADGDPRFANELTAVLSALEQLAHPGTLLAAGEHSAIAGQDVDITAETGGTAAGVVGGGATPGQQDTPKWFYTDAYRSKYMKFGSPDPLARDAIMLTYRANVGPLTHVDDVARRLHDLDSAIHLGEQWGFTLARTTDQAPQSPNRPLGTPVRLHHMTYENPLEVTLTGSGFLIAGVIYVLRMVRDWSSARRSAAAAARQAEAIADEARARASQAWNEADILRWLTREAQAGHWHIPPTDLVNLVRPDDLAALNRLAIDDVTLTLPQSLDLGPQT